MGLISAAVSAAGSTLRDQWKEYFYCDSLPGNVLAVKAHKKNNGFFGNKGSDNVITDGSGVVVADGQCAVIVEQGQVVDICAQPGEYTYDNKVAPSVFAGSLGDAVKTSFAEFGRRFTYGGAPAADQRIYYFNTKEMTGNKFGTPNMIPFRVVDQRAGIDIDINIKCFGEYSFRLADPIRFYTNNAGNFKDEYTVDNLSGQMRTELLNALQPAFAKISEEGIRYSALPGRTSELCKALQNELSEPWSKQRGIELVSIAIASVKADEEDEKMLKTMQRNAAYTNPNLAAATLVGAQAQAMQDAAKNANGAVNGFMGMNMAQNAGGVNANALYQQGAQNNTAQPGQWFCPSCGTKNTGNFCTNCGTKKPDNQ